LGPVAGYRYRTPAVAAVTAVYRAVTNGKKNPVSIIPKFLYFLGSQFFYDFAEYVSEQILQKYAAVSGISRGNLIFLKLILKRISNLN
jgi:hypothetical protein